MTCDTQVIVTDEVIQVVVYDDQIQSVVSEKEIHVVTVGEQGVPGAPGKDGLSAPGAVEYPFAFGDATPAVITTALTGKMIYEVALFIKVPFDGVGAAVTVGDAGQSSRLMAADENVLNAIASSSTHPCMAYNADTQITLSITPGSGASQGSGVVVIHLQQ